MLLHTECFNPYHTNCYFLTDEESGSTVIIDPGCYFRRERTRVQHLIRLNDWHIVQILATHLHIDHIFGVHFLTKAYGCPFGASPLDNDWIDRAPDRCREVGLEVRMPFVSPTFSLAHGDTVRFGSLQFFSPLSVFRRYLVPGWHRTYRPSRRQPPAIDRKHPASAPPLPGRHRRLSRSLRTDHCRSGESHATLILSYSVSAGYTPSQ